MRFRGFGPINHLDFDPGIEPANVPCVVCDTHDCPSGDPYCSDLCRERDATEGSLDDLTSFEAPTSKGALQGVPPSASDGPAVRAATPDRRPRPVDGDQPISER